jgi:hypothetical protein
MEKISWLERQVERRLIGSTQRFADGVFRWLCPDALCSQCLGADSSSHSARICRKISQDIPPAKHSGNLGSFDLTVPRLLEAGCAMRTSSARILPSAPHRIRIRKMTTGTSCSTLVSTADGRTSTRAWTHHDHEEEGRTGRRKLPSKTKALAPG